MSKRVNLESLVDRGFAEGYEAFADVANRDQIMAEATNAPPDAQAAMRMNHLLTVAMVESMNDSEERFEVAPVVGIQILWRNIGVVAAITNSQCFTRIDGPVKREMLAVIKRGYDDTLKEIARARAAEAAEGGEA